MLTTTSESGWYLDAGSSCGYRYWTGSTWRSEPGEEEVVDKAEPFVQPRMEHALHLRLPRQPRTLSTGCPHDAAATPPPRDDLYRPRVPTVGGQPGRLDIKPSPDRSTPPSYR